MNTFFEGGGASAAAAMPGRSSAGDGSADLGTAQFRAFYAELVKAREVALRASEAEADAVARSLSRELAQLIELQSLEARRAAGRSGADQEAQARFLKAALADEIMLHLDWAGRPSWRHVLLETTLFRTSLAGDKVFDEIDRILSTREAAERSCAQLYLHALSLGFKGRYRGTDREDALAAYRLELFQFVYQRQADLRGHERVLSEQAYASTLSHLAARRIPRLNRWRVLFVLAVLLLLGMSELLWLWQSWPVRTLLDSGVALHGPVTVMSGLFQEVMLPC